MDRSRSSSVPVSTRSQHSLLHRRNKQENRNSNHQMASYTKEKLITDSMKAIKQRCIDLDSPLADDDALALSALMAGGDVASINETKYNAIMAQVAVASVAQLNMMLGMAKKMIQNGTIKVPEQSKTTTNANATESSE